MADPKQLTDDEARVLLGLDALPDAQQFGAWVLRGKRVEGMTLGARVLADLLWDDVDFRNVHWAGGTLQRAQLQNTRFSDSSLSRCQFQDVLFIECHFNALQLADVRFERCRFERCVFANLYATGTRFDDCTLDATRILGADLREATLQTCMLSGCELEFVRAARSRMLACTFDTGSLRNCRFSYVDTADIVLSRIELEQALFVGGEHERWQIIAATGSCLKLVSVLMRGLSVSGCDGLADLRLITSQVHEVQLTGNAALIGFMIFRSEVTGLRVAHSALIQASFDEARIGPTSSFEHVSFEGFGIADSQLTRPLFIHCRFSDFFYLHRSTLHTLVVDDLSYDTGLREIHEAVSYPNTPARLGANP